jgi:membrane dipeptidase
VKEAIHNINYVRAVAGLDQIGLGPTSSPRKYALLLAELARDRLWNNASLKKLVGGNIVRVLQKVREMHDAATHTLDVDLALLLVA